MQMNPSAHLQIPSLLGLENSQWHEPKSGAHVLGRCENRQYKDSRSRNWVYGFIAHSFLCAVINFVYSHSGHSAPIRGDSPNSHAINPFFVDGHLVFQQITVYNLPQHLVVHRYCLDIFLTSASNSLSQYY